MRFRTGSWVPLFGLLGLLVLGGLAGCQDKGIRITSVMPNYGRSAGGEEVYINGNGFTPGLTVQFGQRNATGLVIESSQKLRVTTPQGPEGPVDVVIVLDDGKTVVLSKGFRYEKTTEWEKPKKPTP